MLELKVTAVELPTMEATKQKTSGDTGGKKRQRHIMLEKITM